MGAPRVCGDDPRVYAMLGVENAVLPAYAGMIPLLYRRVCTSLECSPRMRG